MPDIDIGGATLHYATSGAGEPILLIPGLGLDHSYYRFGMPLLARHLQVLAVDPRGIGRSTKSPPPYTVEAWADDFAVMIDKLRSTCWVPRWAAPWRWRWRSATPAN